jgi:hypothetical protein
MSWSITVALWASFMVAIVAAVPFGNDTTHNSTFTSGDVTIAKPFVWASIGGSWAVRTFEVP